MKKIEFVKMTGAGNDFILIDNLKGRHKISWSSVAPRLCDRRFGIGADGLLVIDRSTKQDFKMLYFNSDGSSGGMCGNGGRCASRYFMDMTGASCVAFEAVGDTYTAKRFSSEIRLAMKKPKILELKTELRVTGRKMLATVVDSGAPHAVIFLHDLPKPLLAEISGQGIRRVGSLVRYHDHFAPKGTNVDFVDLLRNGTLTMRTYERGVEDETLACGTGAVASAVASAILHGLPSPVRVKTRGGEFLTVKFGRAGKEFVALQLCGSAKCVFQGTVEI